MNAVWHSPGIHALNQNQRYEVLMHFTGYEARVGFPGHEPGMNAGWHSPPPTVKLNDVMIRKIVLTCYQFRVILAGTQQCKFHKGVVMAAYSCWT